MKYWGKKPIVIGTFDDVGKVDDKIIIKPGDEIPERWLELLRNSPGVLMVPQGDPLNMETVEQRLRN